MELHFHSISTITTFFLLLFSIFLLFKKWKKSKAGIQRVNLPPGPPKLPIIGHAHLIGPLPFRSFKTLAKTYGDIMHVKAGEVSMIVISSPEMAKQVLKTHDPVFLDRPRTLAAEIMWYNHKDVAFSSYNEYWRQMRKICIIELLSAKQVRSFGSIRSDEISDLINRIQSSLGSVIDLTEYIFNLMCSSACRSAYGNICRDKDGLSRLMKETVLYAGGFTLADLFPSSKLLKILSWNKQRMWKMRGKVDLILDDIIGEHKENLSKIRGKGNNGEMNTRRGNGEFGNEDIVDVLLRIQENEVLSFPINNDNIKAVIFDMFAGGTENLSALVDWTMVELIRNPHAMAKAKAEVRHAFKDHSTIILDESEVGNLKYLKLVLKETLRLHPPVPMIPRVSINDCEINGYFIPAKTRVIVNNWGIGRDSRYFPNPESFQPERFENIDLDFLGANFEYLPFGSGKRFCPGMNYALAGVEHTLAHLLYHFNWELPDGIKACDLDITERPGLTAPRNHHLHLVASSYI